MADFRIAFTSGVTLETWEDPALGEKPSRVNPQPSHDHTREVGSIGVDVEVTATVRGVGVAPLDAALADGNLFSPQMIEWPGPGPAPAFSGAAGQSSVQTFTPTVAGHYTLIVQRTLHGGIYAHVDVDG